MRLGIVAIILFTSVATGLAGDLSVAIICLTYAYNFAGVVVCRLASMFRMLCLTGANVTT
jgi:hypothetical protein